MAIENTYLLGKNITLGCGFDLQAKAPLDSRQTVPTFEGLRALILGDAAYEGMIVYDEGTKKTYQAQKCEPYSVVVDEKTKTYDIAFREFGLTDEELKALIASETTAAMEFKGATATLPANPAKGDMWKVTGTFEVAGETTKVGDSIVYNGEAWFRIPSGDDIEDTWRPVTGVNNDATLTFAAGNKLDVAVDANGTITYSHEAVDAPKLLAENEQTRTYITEVETDGFGHITGYKTATENVTDTNTTYAFASQMADGGSSVYFQVTDSDNQFTDIIYLDAYNKNEANAAFKAKRKSELPAEDTDANVFVDTVAQDVDGNITITTKAVDFSAVTDRLDELEKIDHSHNFADEEALSAITAAKVAEWDDAVSKEHTHTFADSDVEDAISKKHSHSFTDEAALNGITAAKVASWDEAYSKEHDHSFLESELNKIADGDVAKWNAAEVNAKNYTEEYAARKEVIDSDEDGVTQILAYRTDEQNYHVYLSDEGMAYETDAGSFKIDHINLANDSIRALVLSNEGIEYSVNDEENDVNYCRTVAFADEIPTGALANKSEVAKTDLDQDLANELDAKVASIDAEDGSITIGGSATDPSIAVKISAADGNALELADDGLKVIIPESTKVEASETNGNIKVDGAEVTVYKHPDNHTASEISDFATEVAKVKVNEAVKATQDGNGKVIADTYAEKATTYTKEEVDALLCAAQSWGEF